MKPLRLSDSELDHLMYAAAPIAPARAFLEDIVNTLQGGDVIGPGTLHRAMREAQQRHFDPPIDAGRHEGKYG